MFVQLFKRERERERECVCVYKYIIHRQTVLLYHNSSVWLDTLYASSWNRNQPNFTLDQEHTAQPFSDLMSAQEFNAYMYQLFICLHFCALGYQSAQFV